MIRDPSDGSVREPKTAVCSNCDDTGWVCENHMSLPWAEMSDAIFSCGCGAGAPCPSCGVQGITSDANEINKVKAKTRSEEITGITPVIDPTTSSLPTGSKKAEYLARLEESHTWLRDYYAKKNAEPK